MKKYKKITNSTGVKIGSRISYPYKVAVLAGNFKQYDRFMNLREVDDETQYIYVDRIEKAVGHRFNDLKIIGTFWEDIKDSGRLYDEVKTRIGLN